MIVEKTVKVPKQNGLDIEEIIQERAPSPINDNQKIQLIPKKNIK